MKSFEFTYPDTRPESKQLPPHDRVRIDGNIFLVADGVTVLHQEPYPNTSIEAVDAASEEIIKHIKSDRNGITSIYSAFEKANFAVSKVKNIKEHYGGVTLAYGFLDGEVLYFGQLNDCGIMVFDENGNREIDFILNQSDFINHLNELRTQGKFIENSVEEHKYVREEIVNKKYGFGVMNGDTMAKEYFHVGASSLKSGQMAFFYTDGFIPYVYDAEFVKGVFNSSSENEISRIIEEKEKTDPKYQKERSLVVLRI